MSGFTLKKIFPVIFFLFLFACNNTEEKKPEPPGSTTVNKTNGIIKTPPNPYLDVDVSPMDMSYHPADYPKLKVAKSINTPPLARVIYSRPHLGGRKLFDAVLKYGELWRLGANEATEIQFYKDAAIDGKRVKAGRYILYCIPRPDSWTIVFNSNIDSWGLHPDSTKDILHFPIPAKETDQYFEHFTMVFQKKENIAELVMAWGNIEARLPINF
jgi:hypothetical protein